MRRLFHPKERYNPIDFAFASVPGLSGITGIRLTPAAYARMTEDPFLRQIPEEGELECWYGEESEIHGRYYPPIKYTLLRESDGGAIIAKITYGDEEYELSIDWNFEINFRSR